MGKPVFFRWQSRYGLIAGFRPCAVGHSRDISNSSSAACTASMDNATESSAPLPPPPLTPSDSCISWNRLLPKQPTRRQADVSANQVSADFFILVGIGMDDMVQFHAVSLHRVSLDYYDLTGL